MKGVKIRDKQGLSTAVFHKKAVKSRSEKALIILLLLLLYATYHTTTILRLCGLCPGQPG